MMLSKSIGNIFILILVIYTCDSFGKEIVYKNCGTDGVIQSVDVTPCDETPCPVKSGTEANLKLTFTSAGSSITGITAKAFGVVLGQDVPYPLPNPDGCVASNLTCPLQPGSHVYLSGLKIPADIPAIRLPVKWELVDQNNQVILCFEFPVRVVT